MPIKKTGDMRKALYDKDNNLVVDVPLYTTAERLALPNTNYPYFVFDTDLSDVRIFNPSTLAWNSLGATPTISNDPSPTLGGDLDLNNNDIVGFPETTKGKGLGVGNDGKMKKFIEIGETPPDDTEILWYDTTPT